MQDFHSKHLSRLRRFALHGFALAALLFGTVAGAATLTISGTPATSVLGWHSYSFTPTTTVPSGYTKTFSISGKPSWASFNTSSGTLSGVPATANVGSSSTIVISVSDGPSKASLPAFTLKVLPNITPTITGTPATTATVGTLYSFTPKGTETDGDPLSYSVKNKPSWASFSISTGKLSGTPATANVGTYSNIVISTSTGHASASLAAFTITVKASGSGTSGTTGSATLHWTAPTTNTNGTALTNLAGYYIHYGKSSTALTTTVTISNPGTLSYTINNLASGTWYFAVNAYTSAGTQSKNSNVGSKTVP
jgi:hypothetical protein